MPPQSRRHCTRRKLIAFSAATNQPLDSTTVQNDPSNPNDGELRAGVHAAAQFIDIAARTSYRLSIDDRARCHFQLVEPVSDHTLGAAILECLAKSRTPSLDDFRAVSAGADDQYEQWVQAAMARFGCSRRKLFKGMKSVSVSCRNGLITFAPSHEDKLEGWSGDGFTDADRVSAPFSAAPAQVSLALRLALARCT
jgi:hypothetical protein